MAEADTLTTPSPKQLGKHLREVRRRKGLSLSEVARGAGLTRRELNAYEKGRVPIPDSDLFVIAGSCGVDVSELRAPEPARSLEAPSSVESAVSSSTPAPVAAPMPSTIEDTVAQLRRSQEVAAPSVPAVSGRRRPRALGAANETPGAPAEADWPIERIDPLDAVQWPMDATIPSPTASVSPSPAEPVDVFEELARLPEPAPLPIDDATDPDPFASLPAFLTPPPPGAVEDVDTEPYDEWPTFESEFEPDELHDASDAEPVLVEMPTATADFADSTSAADAPPIDVAARVESFDSPWDTLRDTHGYDTPLVSPDDTTLADAELDAPYDWCGDALSATAPTSDSDPASFQVHTDDDWVPSPTDTSTDWADDGRIEDGRIEDGRIEDGRIEDGWAEPWAVQDPSPVGTFDPRFAATAPAPPTAPAWSHEPDPEATSTGFYIDWGEPDDERGALPPGASVWDPPTAEPVATAAVEVEPYDPVLAEAEPVAEYETPVAEPTVVDFEHETPVAEYETPAAEPTVVDFEYEEPVLPDEPPPISWRPQWDEDPVAVLTDEIATATVAVALDTQAGDEQVAVEPTWVEPVCEEPEPAEHFVMAGAEWELGNAVPLVEVRSTGSLVMRRADERWALADVTAAPDFALEAYVDLRSGPGFGVLFRAETDADGRMSGYSFDVDPVYEGGGYLVREWRADRELWNPIAHVPATDPEAMHGLLAVRVTVDDDRLVASVNGETVLTVDSLKQASADRGREGASGNRVGIQAWSSTDLVIDELRVAEH
jgi:transcriptional regulator with XRE-family HTH domain